MSTITKLGIGLTSGSGTYRVKTVGCLLAAQFATLRHCQGLEIEVQLTEGPYPHLNRQILAEQAIQRQCSHLLMVDGDMFFGPDAMLRLMAHDVDIVGAKYNKRITREPTVKGCEHIIAPVPFVPTGFLLIATSVFEKIGKPYFSMQGAESEDVFFCNRAIAAGFKVWCDPTIRVGHMGEAMY